MTQKFGMTEDMSEPELLSQSKSKGLLSPVRGGLSPIRGNRKSTMLPPIQHRSRKEKGGGGMIYPGAQSRLLDILKSPRANEPL